MKFTKLLALATAALIAGACGSSGPSAPSPGVLGGETAVVEDGLLSVQSVCPNVTEVRVRVLPLTKPPVSIRATYHAQGLPADCTVAPVWTSTPRGRLIPTKDPFVVKVSRGVSLGGVMVVAEAPNGIRGTIKVR